MNALSKTIFPLLILSLGFCLLTTVLGLFGSHHWFLALFANLPLQLAAILIVIAAVLLLTKHQRLALATLLVLLPNLWQLSYYYWPRPYSDQSPSLRVLSFNVRKSNPNHDKVLRHIQSTNADIIALIEVNDHWLKDFSALEETHPYIAHFPNNHNFGLALYSRYPVIKHRRPMPTRGHPLLLAEIDYDGFLLTAVVAHPIPPMNQSGAEFFERYLTSSVNLVAELEGPVLFMGDFNASPWSHLFPSISQKTGLQDSGRGRGFQSTWNRWNPLLTTPIDHVFHSAELQPTARSIGPANGSDHSPILLDFAFHPTLPTPKPAPPNKNTTTPRPNKNTPTKPRLRRVPQSN